MDNITPPSRNLALDGTLTGLMTIFKDKFLQNTDDMLPAKVIAYDRALNRVQVQPLIRMVTTAGDQVQRGQLVSIPVLQIGGGGFVMSFPLRTGDLGWIKANDRDITFFLSTYQQAAPNTARKHSFSDAVFIPDSFMKDVVINAEDSGNLVIQTLDGSVRIAIWPGKVKITAPEIVLDTATTTCTGNLVVDGSITATDDITGEGISLKHHVHSGVQSGGSNTGQPV